MTPLPHAFLHFFRFRTSSLLPAIAQGAEAQRGYASQVVSHEKHENIQKEMGVHLLRCFENTRRYSRAAASSFDVRYSAFDVRTPALSYYIALTDNRLEFV